MADIWVIFIGRLETHADVRATQVRPKHSGKLEIRARRTCQHYFGRRVRGFFSKRKPACSVLNLIAGSQTVILSRPNRG